MDEIRKTILNQILKLDENIGLDKKLITNDTDFLEKAIKKRRTKKIVMIVGLIILMVFIITLPLFNYYNSLKIKEEYITISSFFIVLFIFGFGNISNIDKIINNLENKIFLLKLTHSLNELKYKNNGC
jgi:hypothetical protein